MDEKDYFAVYDKKMLWRANLYIDQKEDALGGKDWNDAYPWNAPPAAGVAAAGGNPAWWSESWGYNEWNRNRNISAAQSGWSSNGRNPWKWPNDSNENTYLNNVMHPIIGDGKQVVHYNAWTRFTNGGNVDNSVAYGWGCSDSPFEFDEEILEQKAKITARRGVDANDNDPATNYQTLAWASQKGAPNTNWDNYIFPKRHLVYTTTTKTCANFSYNGVDPSVTEPTNEYEKQHETTLSIGNTISIPGLSTFLAFSSDNANRKPGNGVTFPLGRDWVAHRNWLGWVDGIPEQVKQSEYTSGLDCSGFVWRSMMYAGRPYITKLNERQTTTGFSDDTYSWQIAPAAVSDDPQKQPQTLDRVVPGDIIVLPGEHIVLVLNVSTDDNSTVKRENITFIQEGKGQHAEWEVQTAQIWGTGVGLIDDKYFLYQVRRLRTNL